MERIFTTLPGRKRNIIKECTSFVIRRNLDSLGRSIIIFFFFFSTRFFYRLSAGGVGGLFCLWWEMGRLDFFLIIIFWQLTKFHCATDIHFVL
jgi:hypothetical protein